MKNKIENDFLKFESFYFKCDNFNYNNFFTLLKHKNVSEAICSFLVNNPFQGEQLDKLFKKDLSKLTSILKINKTDFSQFVFFKTELDILSGYFFLFLLKSFSLKAEKKTNKQGSHFFPEKKSLYDRDDFINTFADFIFKFFLFIEINHKIKFDLSKESLRKLTFRIIELLTKKEIVKIHEIKVKGRHFKSLSLVAFQVPYQPHIALYATKFKHYVRSNVEFYSYNTHFSSLVQITKQAKHSTSHFKIPYDHISVLHERSIFVDRKLLNMHHLTLLAEQGLNQTYDLYKENEALTLQIEKFIVEGNVESLQFCHAKLSKLLTLIRIKEILTMGFDNVRLYLPFMFCFRGRLYELSDLSFTFYKEFRFCMYSGEYENESEKFHPINAQILNTIESQFNLFKEFKWFESLSITRKRACVWTFISIGAMEKERLGAIVHVSAFIKKGVELWEKKIFITFSDPYEQIEFNYLTHLVDELRFSEKKLKKWIFWKDAPASCFQHLLLILGPKNEESYKYCNLNSKDTWYDPYSHLIEDFYKKNLTTKNITNSHLKTNLNLSKEKFSKIFSRKRLKRVFMTESYGAGSEKLTSIFLSDLNFGEHSLEEKYVIMSIWNKLLNYISEDNILFAQSSRKITDHFVKNNLKSVVNPDKTEVDYSCFKIAITQKEFYSERKRHTFQSRSITNEEDEIQFKTSIRANFVHTRDAIVARRYVMITGMWSIHDCFAIDFLNVTYKVALVNELMNGEFFEIKINIGEEKRIYSFFIIL